MLHPSKRMLLIRAQDRAASYIVMALALPLIVFAGVAVAVMLGAPPHIDVASSLLPVLLWDFLALGALLSAFRFYCWLSFNKWLDSPLPYGGEL